MTHNAYVDESKVGGLTLYATVLDACDVVAARTAVSSTRAKGSARLHFCKESNKVRLAALPVLLEQPARTFEFDFRRVRDEPRLQALTAMAESLAEVGVRRIVLEPDDSVVRHDRRVLQTVVRRLGVEISYEHVRPSQEPLLWIPDAIAWCRRNRSRRWRSMVEDAVVSVAHKAA